MNIQNTIIIDLTRPGITHRTYAVEGDSGTRTVQLLLRQGDAEWTVPDGAAASVVYRKSDGTSGWYDALPDGTQAYTVDGSAITVTLAPQMMAVSGVVSAALILRDEDGNQLSTFDFLIDVRSSPADGMVSKNYFNLQEDAFSEELVAWMAQMEQILDGAVQFAQAQELTQEQQSRARENIGAVSADDVAEAVEEAVGATGATGATGVSVTAVNAQFYQSTSSTALSGGSWGTTMPNLTTSTYLWTRDEILFSDGNTQYTEAYCVTLVAMSGVGGTISGLANRIKALEDSLVYPKSMT